MAGQLGSVGFIRGCGGVSAFGMTPAAITSWGLRCFCYAGYFSQVAENSRRLAASATGTRALM
jgi:hypothetical protein